MLIGTKTLKHRAPVGNLHPLPPRATVFEAALTDKSDCEDLLSTFANPDAMRWVLTEPVFTWHFDDERGHDLWIANDGAVLRKLVLAGLTNVEARDIRIAYRLYSDAAGRLIHFSQVPAIAEAVLNG